MTPRVSYWEEKEVRIVIFWGSGATLGRPSAQGHCATPALAGVALTRYLLFVRIHSFHLC